jgi:hypothetical protein
LDFAVCSVADTANSTLAQQAQKAVTEVQPALGQNLKVVIVTAGLAATSAVLQIAGANAIPIVQAAGGALPNPTPSNVTGFVLNPIDPLHRFRTSEEQLQKLVGKSPNSMRIGVLYDSTNGVSTMGALAAVEALAPALNPPPSIVRIDTAGNLASFTVARLLNNGQPCVGFMLLPNAVFYEARRTIAQTVEGHNSPVQFSIYPEREYKKAHNDTTNKFVHGHHIPITFRRAALFVDSLLDGTAAIADLAPQEGITDED